LNFKAFTSSLVNIAEMISLVFEELEPLRISAPDLHVVGSTRTLDVPWLVIQSSSDSQGLLMEVPDLGLSSVWCFNDHVSVVNEIEISVFFEFRNNVEISFNIHAEISIELSFDWFFWILVGID
jgi:hypothetical protein